MVGVPASEIGRRPNWDAASAETARSTWIGWCAEHAILRAPGMQLKPMGMSFSDVFDEFERWGPLIHEPTGIATLDDMTGGGIVYGSSVALLGIPDAGKTMFAIQIAHEYAQRGIGVGFLGGDEEPGDLVTRYLQRAGWSRRQCEQRDDFDIRDMRAAMAILPVRFFRAGDSIEAAGATVAALARQRGTRAALFCDSMQTVMCDAERASGSMHERVTARLEALRNTAREHRLIAISTSEVVRAAYRSGDPAQRISDLAAGKESGSIEYRVRLQMTLRSVQGNSDIVELRISKNKMGSGRRHADEEPGIHLRMDRVRQSLTEATDYVPESDHDVDQRKAAAHAQKTTKDAAIVAVEIARKPGMSVRDLRAAAKAAAGTMGRDRVDVAVARLGEAVVIVPGMRGRESHYLDGKRVPAEVMDAVALQDRPLVAGSEPPPPGGLADECGGAWRSVAEEPVPRTSECAHAPLRSRARHARGGTLDREQSGAGPAATLRDSGKSAADDVGASAATPQSPTATEPTHPATDPVGEPIERRTDLDRLEGERP